MPNDIVRNNVPDRTVFHIPIMTRLVPPRLCVLLVLEFMRLFNDT
jgi:hypothetical protein